MHTKSYHKLVIVSIVLIVIGASGYFIVQKHNKKQLDNKVQAILVEKDFDIVVGDKNAELTVVLYYGYNCFYCKKFFEKGYDQLNDEFIKSKKVKIILRLMTTSRNLQIENALKSIICVNKVGSFEYLHDLLLYNYSVIFSPEFQEIIDVFIEKDLAFAECFLEDDVLEYLQNNYNDLKKLGSKSLPTFVIGNKTYLGYNDYETLKQIIAKHL